jgi:uncharacterized membrane protein
MAGVGFSLRKLHRDDGYTGLFKLYGAAGLISSASSPIATTSGSAT